MVGENFDLGSPPTGYEMGEVALRDREPQRSLAPNGAYSVVDRLSLDVTRRRDRLHLRPDGRRPHRDDGDASPAGSGPPAAACCCTAATSPASRIAERIAAGLVLVPEDRQRDGLVQTMTVGQNLSLASIGAFTRGLFTSSKREQDADRPLDHATSPSRPPAAAR